MSLDKAAFRESTRSGDVTIASSGTTSTALNLLRTYELVGIYTPAALTGTAFTFQASDDGVTYGTVVDAMGANVSITVAVSEYQNISGLGLSGANYIKVVSGSTEGAERTITLVYRPFIDS